MSKRNLRINWDGIVNSKAFGFAFAFVIMGSIVGGIGYGLNTLIDWAFEGKEQRDAARIELTKAVSEASKKNPQFKISGPDTMTYTTDVAPDEKQTNIYNFQSGMVIIDGPDKADRVIQFSEYDKKSDIETALSIGCSLSQAVPALRDKFKDSLDGYFSEFPEIMHGETFYKNHCDEKKLSTGTQLKIEGAPKL